MQSDINEQNAIGKFGGKANEELISDLNNKIDETRASIKENEDFLAKQPLDLNLQRAYANAKDKSVKVVSEEDQLKALKGKALTGSQVDQLKDSILAEYSSRGLKKEDISFNGNSLSFSIREAVEEGIKETKYTVGGLKGNVDLSGKIVGDVTN